MSMPPNYEFGYTKRLEVEMGQAVEFSISDHYYTCLKLSVDEPSSNSA